METANFSRPVATVFNRLNFLGQDERQAFHRELLRLAGSPDWAVLVQAHLLEALLISYRRLEAADTEFNRRLILALPAEQRPSRLEAYFRNLLVGGMTLPTGNAALATLVELVARDLDLATLQGLLAGNTLAQYPIEALRLLAKAHPYALWIWTLFIHLGKEITDDSQRDLALRLVLQELSLAELNEGSPARLRTFLSTVFPAFAERFAHRMDARTLAQYETVLSRWFLLWERYMQRTEPALASDSAYYQMDFTTVIRNVPEYIWWNDGISYGEGPRHYALSSLDFFFLATGGSVRKNPHDYRPYTRRMARAFVELPFDYPHLGPDGYLALYALALGAGARLLLLVNRYLRHPSTTVEIQKEFDRWNPIVQKLSDPAFERLEREAAERLLGYLYHRLRDQPGFRIQRRTLDQLLGEANAYYERIERRRTQAAERVAARRRRQENQETGVLRWEASMVLLPLKREYGRNMPVRQRKIIELLNENQLAQEGVLMQHCVASYSHACRNAGTSIWSLRELRPDKSWRSIATIEVRKGWITQARGRFNAAPEEEAQNFIHQWAKMNRLHFFREEVF